MRAEQVMEQSLGWWRYQYEDIHRNSSKDYIITVERGQGYIVRAWWGRIGHGMQSRIYFCGGPVPARWEVGRLRGKRIRKGYVLVGTHPYADVFSPHTLNGGATPHSTVILEAEERVPIAPTNPPPAIAPGVRTGRRKIQLRRNRT